MFSNRICRGVVNVEVSDYQGREGSAWEGEAG